MPVAVFFVFGFAYVAELRINNRIFVTLLFHVDDAKIVYF